VPQRPPEGGGDADRQGGDHRPEEDQHDRDASADDHRDRQIGLIA
jgi:hypothetical protein